jgi:folate-binding protein YgfZ
MSPLQKYHRQHAQEFITLAGYEIPRRYADAASEYRASLVAAMTDASFLGKLRVTGKDRESLLHRLTTNEMRKLSVGGSRVNVFTNAKGRVVDRVEMLNEGESYLLLTSPGRAGTLGTWIDKYTFVEEVKSNDLTSELAVIALFGEESALRVRELLSCDASTLTPGLFLRHHWQGEELIVHYPEAANPARLQIISPTAVAENLWKMLLAAFTPIGYDTHETLRVLQGIPAADHEIVENYNPHEIGLYPFINFDKGCYIGQEVVARLDTYQKVQRQLLGVSMPENSKAIAGAALFIDDQEIGMLTSVAPAPEGAGAIGLAVVRKQQAQAGVEVEVRWPEGTARATLVALPFAPPAIESAAQK